MAMLVAAPYLAHRLRRQRAEERPFAATRLVAPTPPKARRRSRLEDRALFGVRAASVLALALLGASPLVQCSRLAMTRGGASVAVAIVLDDSMSMQAAAQGAAGGTRFTRAKAGAQDILAALREGDAAAIVLAGSPARVALAATTDIASARVVLDAALPSDRATDLDGALAIAKTLIGELPQVDRRVVVLSDLADGKADAPPLGAGSGVPVWVAMPELAGVVPDCALLSADRTGARARVRFACNAPKLALGREVRIVASGHKDELGRPDANAKVLGSAPLPDAQSGEVQVAVGDDGPPDVFLAAELSGSDAITSDDRAPVVVEVSPAALAVVSDRRDDSVTTGGAPVVEQAVAALHVDLATRPIPQPPDRREDTAPFAAIVVDDPPGFTPEQRRALAAFCEGGGVLFLALGPRAAAAPLGANFEPFLGHPAGWGATTSPGADPASAPSFGESAGSLAELSPKGRTRLSEQDVAGAEVLARWTDGAPLLLRRALGRGEVWFSTLPFSVDESDLALRPGFLSALDAFVAEAKQRSAPRRGDVGAVWAFASARTLVAEGPLGPVTTLRDDGTLRVVPPVIGAYRLTVDGLRELRVAAPVASEIDTRPRAVAPGATSTTQGGGVAVVDVSWAIALALLGLVACELALRLGAGLATRASGGASGRPVDAPPA
jgi:hypothetical protein